MTRLFNQRSTRLHLLLPLLALVAGCQAAGVLLYKTMGDPEIPAQYELPKKPTIIMVENFRHSGMTADDADLLGRLVHQKATAINLVPLIAYEKLLELKATQPIQYGKMTVTEIARKLEAEQVLYIHLESGGVASMGGGSVHQGKASVLVKVIDATTGDTLWPAEIEDGRGVNAETNPIRGTDRYRPEDIRTQLYDDLAMKIVRLFHKWKPDSSDQ